jgi:hypothetical protein
MNSYIIIKNVDVKYIVYEAFLEQSSSGTLKIEILESQIIKSSCFDLVDLLLYRIMPYFDFELIEMFSWFYFMLKHTMKYTRLSFLP